MQMEGELWLKYKKFPFHRPHDAWKGQSLHLTHPAQDQAPQPAPQPSAPQRARIRTRTNFFPEWRFHSLEGTTSEQVSSGEQVLSPALPRQPSTRTVTSLAPGLGQCHFHWEHWGSGKVARLVTAAYKEGIQQ